MPADGEIIIDVDVDSDKLDKKLKEILDKTASKKVELQIETKDLKYLKLQLEELDNQIKSLENPGDELIKSFENTRDAVEKSIQKVLVLKESIKSLTREFKQEFKAQSQMPKSVPTSIHRLISSYQIPFKIAPEIDEQALRKMRMELASKKVAVSYSLSNEDEINKKINSLKEKLHKLNYSDPELVKNFSALNDELEKAKSKTSVLQQKADEMAKSYEKAVESSNKLVPPLTQFRLALENMGSKDLLPNIFDFLAYSIKKIEAPVNHFLTSISNKIRETYNNLKNGISAIYNTIKEKITAAKELFKNLFGFISAPFNFIRNLFDKFNTSSTAVSNSFKKITSGFNNIKSSALSASHHVDYFSRRIFNLLRNAFVFNIISRQFRGLSSLLGNLINRDTIFVRTLMLVKANLVRAFAPIWQIILPFIRLLGEGLLWLSKIFIRFINFLTGSNIKPVETFKEAKQVVGDFYKIASPKKEMFDLEKPQKATKKLKDNSNKISKNNKNLNKGLNKTNKISNKLLASFDKLETLKFDKNKLAKDPFGLEELKKPKSNDQKLNLDVNVPSVEDQISDAINNIQDKPLDFMVNDNIGDQITSEVNGLKLPTLNFKVDKKAQSWVDNLRTKLMEFYVWIQPLIESIGNFILALGDSFKRLYEKLEEDGTFKMIAGWFDDWKNSLTDLFNTISNNPEAMDKLRNWIVAIGVAFITYKIVSSVSSLVMSFTQLISLFTSGPIGWLALFAGGLVLVALNSKKAKEKIMEFYNWISPLIIAIKNFAFALVDSFKRLYEDLDKKGFFKLIVKWVTKLKEKLTDFFDMLAKNQDKMDNLRNFIVGIGMAFMAFKIIQKVSRLFSLFTSLVSLLAGNPLGWFLMLASGVTMVALKWDKLKEKIPVVTDLMEKFCKDSKKEIGELGDEINNDIKEAMKWIGEKLNDMLLWFDKHPGVLQAISDIFSAAVKLLKVIYEIIKFTHKVSGIVTELAWKSIGEKLSEAFDFHGKLPDISHKIKGLPPIPKLAQGSVLRGGDPFLSWVNDQPRGQTNVEAPLNTIVSAFKQALSESEFNNQPEINITASGDMSEIIRLLNFKLQDERIRVGNAFIENIN